MKWHKILRDYFTFNRNDRIGVSVLVFLILLSIFIPRLFPSKAISTFEAIELSRMADTLHTPLIVDEEVRQGYSPGKSEKRLQPPIRFVFDPNSATLDEWQKLGLKEKTAQTILNYRNKGGRFRTREDLRKIWGLPTGFYESVKEFISIPDQTPNSDRIAKTAYPRTNPGRKITIVDINEADSSTFEQLPGIGPTLAARIVNFREKLGGYYSVEQIREIYGMKDSTFASLLSFLKMNSVPSLRNINEATKEELASHPYIRYKIANAIVAYRQQHGNFKQMNELLKIDLIHEELLKKLIPYFSAQ